MKYRKIGITGGSGFIGKRLLSRFQDESYETKSFEGNIMNKEDLEGFFDGCDAVVHLAGVFSNNFEQLLEVNVLGTRNVVDACIKSGVKKINLFLYRSGVRRAAKREIFRNRPASS